MSNSKTVMAPEGEFGGSLLDQAEYEALETALLQTARGRGFLQEYLRRNGAGGQPAGPAPEMQGGGVDTERILAAVERLHEAVMGQQQPGMSHVRMDILEMAKAIARTREEIAAMRTDGDYDHLSVASEEMDAIVQSTEKATNDILQAAEKIQEVAWRLREAGASEEDCEEIDNQATNIYMACSFQDLTGQRTTKVIRVLQYLEARITSMIEIWGLDEGAQPGKTGAETAPGSRARPSAAFVDERPDAHLLNGPQSEDQALGQDNIDALMEEALVEPEDMPGGAEDQGAAGSGVPDAENTRALAEDTSSELLGGEDRIPDEAELDALFENGGGDDPIDEEQLKALFS